jgi:lipopolysaccharide transport system ATP-binding protein
MTVVIKVENLGKKYLLSHQAQKQPYVALRDVIAERTAAIGRKLLHPFHSSPFTLHPSQEDFWALKDVSFEIKQGDRVGIIGRNGAGKSTLLKVLSRIVEPTTGRVRIKGRVASLLEVGTGFHPELTGRENIFLNGAILGMTRSEIRKKFDEIVDFAEIEKFLDTPVKRYSSGMYVRLAFAVAAHLEPEILLVDEVLAVGDAQFQKKCLGKMEDVSVKEGRTVLFVSHNMLAVKNLCSSAMLLKQGLIDFLGNIGGTIERYMNDKSDINGEIIWPDRNIALGNEKIRLHGVRIVSNGNVTASPSMDREIEIQIDYWNLEPNVRRLVSIHVINVLGTVVFTSANTRRGSIQPDPWYEKKYPVGLFRTSCVIPASILNEGHHSVDVYINGLGANDNILFIRGVLSFDVTESDEDRSEYLGEWIGAVRPKLHWYTTQLD